jgi:hypothetical protein
VVLLGNSQPPVAGHRRRLYRPTPLGRHPALVPQQDRQWLIEGINSLVQAAKAKARGYRSIRNLTAMIYLLVGKLDLKSHA